MSTATATGRSLAPSARREGTLTAVGILTVAAFVLRLTGFDQSLFGDEGTLYFIVEDRGLGDMLERVEDGEKTPPLHFLLAWASGQLGDGIALTRLPSLILGTATVPLVYLLGARTVGRNAGLVGAALVALAPFAIYYGVENRAYATLTCISAVSTLALLRALSRGGRLSWLAYGATTAAVLYTHYTAVFVVLGQLGWALWTHRDRWRQLALVHAGVALAYLPWLPSFFIQLDHSSSETTRLAKQFPLSGETVADMFAHVLPGYPFVGLSELPGGLLVGVFWGAIGAALVAMTVGVRRRRRGRGRADRYAATRTPSALIVVLALVTPLGLVLYSIQPDTSVLVPRNLSASLPAIALLVGWILTSLRRPFALAAVGLVLAALVVGTAKTQDADYQRAQYLQVAHLIDDLARPGDVVLANSEHYLGLYFERRHRTRSARGINEAAWEHAAAGGRVFLVREQAFPYFGVPQLAGPESRIPLRDERSYPGRFPLTVGVYSGEVGGSLRGRGGEPTITWSLGRYVEISPDVARGFVDDVSDSAGLLRVTGWATDRAGQRGAKWVLVFTGRRLLAVGWPRLVRPDVAKSLGEGAILSGYSITARVGRSTALADPSRLRVFAIVGGRASELQFSRNAKRWRGTTQG